MGHMKDLDIRIRQGGDDAVAAACELAGLAKERRGYEEMKNATGDITDIVTVLRGIGFAAVPPSAGDSASLLHYCVTHAADEIEHLREVLSQKNDCLEPDNGARQDILTDKERWAIEASIAYLQPVENYDNRVQTVLRKLLERLA
jgi:hypothetical protein